MLLKRNLALINSLSYGKDGDGMTTYVLFDLESIGTEYCEDVMNLDWKEIIEIGAYKLCFDEERTIMLSDFHTFVCPFAHKLNRRQTSVTHIQEEDLIKAPCYNDAIESFIRWAGRDSVFVFWGNSKVRMILDNNRRNWIDDFPRLKFMDLQSEYDLKKRSSRKTSLEQAVMENTGRFIGIRHSSMADAFNMISVIQKLRNVPLRIEKSNERRLIGSRNEPPVIDAVFIEKKQKKEIPIYQRVCARDFIKGGDEIRQLKQEQQRRLAGAF